MSNYISPDQIELERGLDPGQRAGFRFTEDPAASGWTFYGCPAETDDEQTDECLGCAGWGYECWAIWLRGIGDRTPRRGQMMSKAVLYEQLEFWQKIHGIDEAATSHLKHIIEGCWPVPSWPAVLKAAAICRITPIDEEKFLELRQQRPAIRDAEKSDD